MYVKDHQKDLFRTKIEDSIKKFLKSNPLPKSLKCEKYSVYLNDEKTRTFLAVDLENNSDISKLIELIDKLLKDFSLPEFYSEHKLHFSFLWCQGNQSESLKSILNETVDEQVNLKEIIIKCGNKISKIAI